MESPDPINSSSSQPESLQPDDAPRAQQELITMHLAAAVRNTLASLNANETVGFNGAEKLLSKLACYHSDKSVAELDVASDVVKALASTFFPSPVLAPAIERWSSVTASLLLQDPLVREDLEQLWLRAGGEAK